MKKYRVGLWGIVCVSAVVTIGLIALAPSQVVMHFGDNGQAPPHAPRHHGHSRHHRR